MHITCEKCSTTYVLDDALIPPQGVPVQCTRCAHVFTAKVPAAAAPPPPAAQQPGNSTMMFGAPAAPPSASPKNTTMMFGGPQSAPASSAAKNQTMMFGAPPNAPEAPKNQTMMFGTPASNAAPPPAAPQPTAGRSTMMFGTPASNAAPPAAPQPAVGRSTMMFGAPAPAAEPPKNTTMMFGTPASNAAASAAGSADSAAAPGSKTLVFGGASLAPAAAKNQTMMFGTPASNAAAQASEAAQAPLPQATKTQVYGDDSSEETIMDSPGQSSRTLIFGGPLERPTEEAPASAKNTTMMFGRSPIPKVTAGTVELAGIAADENAPNESTVRVDESQVTAEQDDAGEPQPPPRQDRTQRFAMSELSRPAGDKPRSPPMLAPVPANPGVEVESIDLSAGQTLRPGQVDPASLDFDPHRTLPPDLQVTPPTALPAVARPEVIAPPGALGVTQPDLPPLETSPGYRLQLENPDTQPGLLGAPLDLQAAQADAAAQRAAQKGGSGKGIIIALIVIALALSGLLLWRLFGKQLLGEQVSEQALKLTGDAFALLRRDDPANQARAVEELRAVLSANPRLVSAQAALVVALAAQFDDAQATLRSGEEQLAKVKAQGATQADLDARQTVLIVQTEAVQRFKKQLDEAHARLTELAATVERGSSEESALVRADGFARGVKGDAEAISRAVQFAQLNPSAPDAWAGLIEPEYALNGGTQLDEAVKQLEGMHDDAFFRPAVLLARLELMRGNSGVAAERLERVVQLNDQHALAKTLLSSISR